MEKISNISILQSPLLPLEPISPNLKLNFALGFVFALCGGLGLVFFSEFLDTSLQRPDDVENILEIPVIGSVGEMGHLRP